MSSDQYKKRFGAAFLTKCILKVPNGLLKNCKVFKYVLYIYEEVAYGETGNVDNGMNDGKF